MLCEYPVAAVTSQENNKVEPEIIRMRDERGIPSTQLHITWRVLRPELLSLNGSITVNLMSGGASSRFARGIASQVLAHAASAVINGETISGWWDHRASASYEQDAPTSPQITLAALLPPNSRIVGNAEVIPVSPAAFSRRENGLRTAVSGKLNLLRKKTTFYNLRVSEFTSALSLVRGETGTTFRRFKDRRDRINELYEQVAALG